MSLIDHLAAANPNNARGWPGRSQRPLVVEKESHALITQVAWRLAFRGQTEKRMV